MKKILTASIVIIVTILLTSCNNEEEMINDEINLFAENFDPKTDQMFHVGDEINLSIYVSSNEPINNLSLLVRGEKIEISDALGKAEFGFNLKDFLEPREEEKEETISVFVSSINSSSQLDIKLKSFVNKLIVVADETLSDHTSQIQEVLDQADAFDVVYFEEGVYYVSQLIIPNKNYIKLISDGAVIKANSDSDFMIGTANYISTVNYVGTPLRFDGFRLESNGFNVKRGIILRNWNSEINNNTISGFETGIEISTKTSSGVNLTTTLVNNKIQENKIICKTGIKVTDVERNKATDFFITNNLIYSPSNVTGYRGIHLDACAGTLVQGNHIYSMHNWDLYISVASVGLRVIDNYFEGENYRSIKVSDFIDNETLLFSGNVINSRVQLYDVSTGYNSILKSSNNVYRSQGHLFCQWSRITLISEGDSFQSNYPYRSHNKGTPAKTFAFNSYVIKSNGNGVSFFNGEQTYYTTNQVEYFD
ncbi:right-handed parallel beta-helix repeat-containing protein [Aquimarina mytili]|uniref:Uncharacterized protein n=1 Tax=Aquimarina mytili TaxID=874423 RepID=A0A937DD31_9FLAO|nr:NosD domain-containing protein [Aquimarina mytili]MBL0685586.1 hypothetical protein [Aquimarina mytili]